ncbi:NEQ246 [Nanoarchaeum equitans Kin4-M]|uniref:NEQ246 n=1 Tax=Nanoarchaeum equitans (strain Kin4-M) TaxID=228908 RepID=Q74NF8_NANEQ|nr:NEQ246 [Nanoarchaeum equitans Kin4-M]
MRRALESVNYLILLALSLFIALFVAKNTIFQSIKAISLASEETTISAIKNLKCSVNPIDVKELAKEFVNKELNKLKFLDLELDDYTLSDIKLACLKKYGSLECNILEKYIEYDCYKAFLYYMANFGNLNSALACFYIIYGPQYKNQIACCTPSMEKPEIYKKLEECSLIDSSFTYCGKKEVKSIIAYNKTFLIEYRENCEIAKNLDNYLLAVWLSK